MSPAPSPANPTLTQLAAAIDHTLLKPEATAADIDKLCDEARQHRFAAVCVNSCWVPRCAARLAGSGVVVASVAGFPLGANLSAVKAEEARQAVEAGAREIDMVVNIGWLRDAAPPAFGSVPHSEGWGTPAGGLEAVVDDIGHVVAAVRRANQDAIVKVILETGALTDEQIILGCRAAEEAKAQFVKTSTGFHASGGATVAHVRLLCKHASPLRVKASGGIRDYATAVTMLEAGAARLGTSAGVAIVTGATGTAGY